MDESLESAGRDASPASTTLSAPEGAGAAAPLLLPQACSCGSGAVCTCSHPALPSYVYAIGALRAAYPSDTIKAAFDEAISRLPPQFGVPDEQLRYEVLRQGENLALAREMCWILQIDGVDAYLLKPRTYVELYELILAIEPIQAGEKKLAIVIGPRGPLAPPELCNGLQLPLVVVNQLYHFTVTAFVQEMSRQANVPESVVQNMLAVMLGVADNAGETDEHRALNYLATRYPGLYVLANTLISPPLLPPTDNPPYTLSRISAQPAAVQGTRRVIDVVFQFTQRLTGEVIHWYCRVDVTGQFPFLVSKLTRYYPHP